MSIGKVQVSMSAASALAHLCGSLSISTEKPLSGLGQSLSIHFINIYRPEIWLLVGSVPLYKPEQCRGI